MHSVEDKICFDRRLTMSDFCFINFLEFQDLYCLNFTHEMRGCHMTPESKNYCRWCHMVSPKNQKFNSFCKKNHVQCFLGLWWSILSNSGKLQCSKLNIKCGLLSSTIVYCMSHAWHRRCLTHFTENSTGPIYSSQEISWKWLEFWKWWWYKGVFRNGIFIDARILWIKYFKIKIQNMINCWLCWKYIKNLDMCTCRI